MSRWGDALARLEITHDGFNLRDKFGVIVSHNVRYLPVGAGLQQAVVNMIIDSRKTVKELRTKYKCLPVDMYTVVVHGGASMEEEVFARNIVNCTEEQATKELHEALKKFHPTIAIDDYEDREPDHEFPYMVYIGDKMYGCLIWDQTVIETRQE